MGKALIAKVCIKRWAPSERIWIQGGTRRSRTPWYVWTAHLMTCGQKDMQSKLTCSEEHVPVCLSVGACHFLISYKFENLRLHLGPIPEVTSVCLHSCYQSDLSLCTSKHWETDLMQTSTPVTPWLSPVFWAPHFGVGSAPAAGPGCLPWKQGPDFQTDTGPWHTQILDGSKGSRSSWNGITQLERGALKLNRRWQARRPALFLEAGLPPTTG